MTVVGLAILLTGCVSVAQALEADDATPTPGPTPPGRPASASASATPGSTAPAATPTTAAATTARATAAGTPTPTTPPPLAPQEPEDQIDCSRVACLALTFDDGPGSYEDAIVSAFTKAGAKATFFVIGRNAVNFPEPLRRTHAAGMEIGDHTQNHVDLSKTSTAGGNAELEACAVNVKAVTGVRPALMRPPYGGYGAGSGYDGFPVVLWNNDTQDWLTKNADTTQERAVAGAKPGGIVLMHELDSTAHAVPAIIERLRRMGFRLVTVSKLLGSPQPGGLYRQRG